MFADDHCARFFASEKSENLRGFAIKPFAKFDVWWNRFRPPIAFHVTIFFNVAHGFWGFALLRWKIS
jgi:hypothetical protein